MLLQTSTQHYPSWHKLEQIQSAELALVQWQAEPFLVRMKLTAVSAAGLVCLLWLPQE